jgi:hypothetical protein
MRSWAIRRCRRSCGRLRGKRRWQSPDVAKSCGSPCFRSRARRFEMESFANGLGEEHHDRAFAVWLFVSRSKRRGGALKGQAGDEKALGPKVGARYVLQGSIRKGGSGIRVTAQLVDTQTGTQLWAETYNRDLQNVHHFRRAGRHRRPRRRDRGDSYGVLVHSMRARARRRMTAVSLQRMAIPVFRLPRADHSFKLRRAQEPAGEHGEAGRAAVGPVGLPRANLC